MTNGELIQEDFNCEVCELIPEDDIIHVIFSDKNDSAIGFDWSWWNMEHKEPITKHNLGVDAISRADALDSIATMCSAEELDIDFAKLLLLQRGIKALPPVTLQEPKIVPIAEIKYDEDKLKEVVNKAVLTITPQEPKTGHWIRCKCDKCGYEVQPWNTTNYCPNCGAKMVEPQESEEKA